jgi:hypothetical protein
MKLHEPADETNNSSSIEGKPFSTSKHGEETRGEVK